MKRGLNLILILLTFIFLVQVVSAVDTKIKIKTLPAHDIIATAFDNSGGGFIALTDGLFKGTTDANGEVNFVFKTERLDFNLIIYVKKDGENIKAAGVTNPERILAHETGKDLIVEIYPDWYTPKEVEPEVNDTDPNETGIVEIPLGGETEVVLDAETGGGELEAENKDSITGKSIFGDEGIISTSIIYYILIIFGLLAVIFVTARLTQHQMLKKGPGNIKVIKLSEMKKVKDEKLDKYKKIIEDAENQIKEAKEEIQKAREESEKPKPKHKEKIDEMKKKIEEYEKEIIKLRQEDKE